MRTLDVKPSGKGRRVAVVASRFNAPIVRALLGGALRTLLACGVKGGNLTVVWVPGAFEIPVVARRLASSRRYDALVAVGCVLQGGTPHFELVAEACTRGIEAAARETGVPIGLGVLACRTEAQARARSRARGVNRGAEAALAALETAAVLEALP